MSEMTIKTAADFVRVLGLFTNYPRAFFAKDGGCICEGCAGKNVERIKRAFAEDADAIDTYRLVLCTTLEGDEVEVCEDCGLRINGDHADDLATERTLRGITNEENQAAAAADIKTTLCVLSNLEAEMRSKARAAVEADDLRLARILLEKAAHLREARDLSYRDHS
jgi:hypothetical protein